MALLALVFPLFWNTTPSQAQSLTATAAVQKAVVVDGVPLVPMTSHQIRECQTLARHLKRDIPCPGLLPDPIPVTPTSAATLCPGEYGAFGEGSCGPAALAVTGGLLEISESNFQVPPGYAGVTISGNNGAVLPETSISGGPLGHFVFMSGPGVSSAMTNRPAKHGLVPPYCVEQHPPSPLRIHGHLAREYSCGEATHPLNEVQIVEGHTLLVWNDGGLPVEVSFHGHSQTNVDLDVAVANATVLVSPHAH